MSVEALVVYDVNTTTVAGQRRLRLVARTCEGLGRRVQYSVFEVTSTEAQLITLAAQLGKIVQGDDRIRIYRLDHGTLSKVQQLGRTASAPVQGAVIL